MLQKGICAAAAVGSSLVVVSTLQLRAEVEFIYYATDNAGSIMRIDGDGRNATTIIDAEPNTQIEAFTIDPFENEIYWNGKGIQFDRSHDLFRASLDGGERTLILERSDLPAGANPGSPNVLLIDPLRRTLTIGGADAHDIVRAGLDGRNIRIAVPDVANDAYIFGMDIDAARGILYWTVCCPDDGDDGIMRQSIDTGERVDGPWLDIEPNPHGLAIDPLNEKLYWGRDTEIARANLDASGVETVLANLPRVDRVKLDVLGGKVYWLGGLRFLDERPVRTLWRANLDGRAMETVLAEVQIADFYLAMRPVSDADFRIMKTRLTPEGFLLVWNGIPGERFDLEASSDLNDWAILKSDWPAHSTGVTACLIDPDEIGANQFFRIRRNPGR